MKVLILHPQLWIYGGAERVIVNLCNYLTEHHIENTILTTSIIPEIKKELKDTRIIEAENYEEMLFVLHDIADDFDVINIHNEPCQLMIFPRQKNTVWLCNEPPASYFQHGDVGPKEKDIVRKFIKQVVVADEFNQKRFKDIYGMNSEIVSYGIDSDFFSEEISQEDIDDFKLRYNIDEKDFVITQVGFIAPTKNQLKTVELFKQIKEKVPRAKLILAGQPLKEYTELVKKRVEELGLFGSVEITGKLHREELRKLYNCTDVTLMPVKSQGSWLSVFESICAGAPVIVTNDFTGSELMEREGIGYVAENDEDIVNSIVSIEDRPEAWETDHERDWIKENLTWDKFCEKMVQIFEEACK